MKFDRAITHADDGYLVTDPDDTILYANLRAQQYLELPGEISSQRFREAALRRYHCQPEEAWLDWPGRPDHPGEIRYLIRPGASDSPPVWLQVESAGQLPEVSRERLLRLHDVSDSMAAAFNVWTIQHMISHKFRAPLTTLMASLEMMNLDRNLLSPGLRELVDLSRLSAKRLQQDLGDLAQFGKRRLSPFRLADLPDLVDRLGNDLQLRRVAVCGIRQTANPSLTPSSVAVEAIMAELLANARNAHPEHDPQIRITVAAHDDRRLAIRVINDGASFTSVRMAPDPDHRDQRVTSCRCERSDAGSGLSMVAAMVWESGGSFHLTSRNDGPGVIAEIILPVMGEGQHQGGTPCRT